MISFVSGTAWNFTGRPSDENSHSTVSTSTPETCVNCDLVKRCTNSCGCANRMNTGNENQVSPLQCTYERMLIEISDALGEELYQIDPERFMKEFA